MSIDLLSVVLGTAGGAIGPAAGEFGKRIAGRLADDFYDKLRHLRGQNVTATVERSAQMVEDSGRAAHEVPPRILIPILEAASVEDDLTLRERWAALLANAAVAEEAEDFPPQFATTLARLTPFAARVIESFPSLGRVFDLRAMLVGKYSLPGAELSRIAQLLEVPADARLRATLDLLVANGLLHRDIEMPDDSNLTTTRSSPTEKFDLTDLGKLFLEQCHPPAKPGASLPGEASL